MNAKSFRRPILVSIAGTAVVLAAALAGCNGTRKQECDKFLSAMKPLDDRSPSADSVDGIQRALAATSFQDKPLEEYASSTKATLKTLASTLHLQESPSPPDGTDDLVKAKLKEARGEQNDVTRYCAE